MININLLNISAKNHYACPMFYATYIKVAKLLINNILNRFEQSAYISLFKYEIGEIYTLTHVNNIFYSILKCKIKESSSKRI